jgi:hypothetical protein
VKGKENRVIDALRKKFHVASMRIFKSYFRVSVLEALATDEFYLQVKEEL